MNKNENSLPLYKNECVAAGGSAQDVQSHTVQNFQRMLRNNFPEDELAIEGDSTKKIVVWMSGTLMFDRASSLANMIEGSHHSAIYECAKLLRNDILGQQIRDLEEPFTVEKVMAGEIEAPESVKEFFSILYACGNRNITDRKQRLVDSSSADAVYECSVGALLPGKHLALGLAVKSMTGSRSMVSLLNRFGHCASGETVRRIDMGFECTIKNTSSLIPSDIVTI